MDSMFKNIQQLTSVSMTSTKNTKIKSMISTFEACINLQSFDITGFDFTELKSMRKTFYKTNILNLNIKDLKTNNIEDMSYMLADGKEIKNINLSNLDTSNVKNMSHMFSGCTSLSEIDVSKI